MSAGRKQAASAEAPVMRKWRLERLVLTGHLLLVVGRLAQEGVTQDTGNARVTGVEAAAHPALGVVGQVLGVVHPPRAVVIPKVVERIGGGGPDGEDRPDCRRGCRCRARGDGLRCAHGCFSWLVETPGTRAIKKRPHDRVIRKGA